MTHRMRRLTAAIATAIGLATVVLAPSPAWALTSTTYFYYYDGLFSTAPVAANVNHKIYAKITPYNSLGVDCWVRDTANSNAVGHLWTTSNLRDTLQVITGLYGTYQMFCVQIGGGSTWGSGEVTLSNDTWRTG